MAKKTKAPTPVKTDFTPEEIAAKRATGLTLEQALQVLRAQAEHDATDPHDEAPEAPVEEPKAKA